MNDFIARCGYYLYRAHNDNNEISMKSNNYLSDEELDMLFNLSELPNDRLTDRSTDQNDAKQKLIALLDKAKCLHVEANFGPHHLRFPIQIFNDDFGFHIPDLGIPEIYEYVASSERPWRLDKPTKLKLLTHDLTLLPCEIINISTSGLLIKGDLDSLNLGTKFSGILSGPDISLNLSGTVIRNKLQKNAFQEWAIRLTLDAFAHETLQNYIYQQHQAKYLLSDSDVTTQNSDVESP